MTKKYLLGAGAVLALSLAAAAVPASAQQVLPPNPSTQPGTTTDRFDDSVAESHCAPASQVRNAVGVYVGCRTDGSSAGPGQSLERYVVVRGARHELIRPDPDNPGQFESARWTEPEAARYLAREDEHTVFSKTEWESLGWSPETFEAISATNQHLCSATANYVVRFTSLATRYARTRPEMADIRDRYIGMVDKIENAGNTRTGANIFASAISWFGGPVTGAIVTGNSFANERQGEAWEDMTQLNRDHGELTLDLDELHVDYNLLSLEVYVSYLGMITDYCTMVYSDA